MAATSNSSKNGLQIVDLVLDNTTSKGPRFLNARLLPDRALMMLQAQACLADGRVVDVLFAPKVEEAANLLNGGAGDFNGNASFSFGAAILAPYANRIRGQHAPQERSIVTKINGRTVRLPANGGGSAPGAETYAIHGLILAMPVNDLRTFSERESAQVTGVIQAGDFGAGWPSSTHIRIGWELRPESILLTVVAENVGAEKLPIGLGWHPYFAIPSQRREQARMRIPARSRIAVNNYDEVLPTGEIVPVGGSKFDFRQGGGSPLEDRYLDDCFVDLDKEPSGETVCEVIDPASRYGLRIVASSPYVSAVQTFARPDRAFVVIEPQFNWADPYGDEWDKSRNRGMVSLEPGEAVEYSVRLELIMP